MKLRLPNGEIREYDHQLKVIKGLLAAHLNIPANQQIFISGNHIITSDTKKFSKNDMLDLAINPIDNYVVCSIQNSELLSSAGYVPLITPSTIVRDREFAKMKSIPRFYDTNSIYLDNDKRKNEAETKAKPFLEQFEKTKSERRRNLKSLLKKLNQRTKVITTCNSPYIVLLKNFVASCEANGIDIRENLIVFPMDQETEEACEQLNVLSFYREDYYGPSTSTHGKYGDRDFVICMFMKNAIVQDMFELGQDIIFMDVDMVWLKDPIQRLESIATINSYDFMFMFDGMNPRFQPLYYNSGFFYAKNNPFSRRTWKVIYDNYDTVWAYRSQQTPLNIVMNYFGNLGLRTHRLDPHEFMNGHLITPNRKNTVDKRTYLVHASWTLNLEFKIRNLKAKNLWFLS